MYFGLKVLNWPFMSNHQDIGYQCSNDGRCRTGCFNCRIALLVASEALMLTVGA
jgi:hypothetical protein